MSLRFSALVAPALAALALAGCETAADTVRLDAPALAPAETVAIAYRSVSIREVSLPIYAAADEIPIRVEGGALTASIDGIWADQPGRAVALELARILAQATGALVASEPWPFESRPEARVDVRIEEFAADAAGVFRIAGQYFVAPWDPDAPERMRVFAVEAAYAPGEGLPALAAARAAAVRDLALLIAREGLG